MPIEPDLYFDLSRDELREVTRFAATSADEAVALAEAPVDPRTRAALKAAWAFADGDADPGERAATVPAVPGGSWPGRGTAGRARPRHA